MARRPGHDPTRRNRNQGTAKRGHGEDNRNVVPDRWCDPRYLLEQIDDYVVVRRKVHGIEIPFVVQRTLPGCVHACTVDDIARVLSHVPAHHLFGERFVEGLSGLVLRQPTRRSRMLMPAWGRILYRAHIGPISGRCIYLDAGDIPLELKWGRHLGPERKAEIERLLEEADEVTEDKRSYHMRFELGGVRRVQLYRTLLHEIGHMVHFQEFVQRAEVAAAREENREFDPVRRDELEDLYHSHASAHHEAFAHRYAEQLGIDLRVKEVIPFDRVVDERGMRRDGLDPADFSLA